MKKIICALIVLIPAFLVQAGDSINGSKDDLQQQVKKDNPVEVYYVHMERRCATCQAVEEVAKSTLETNYSKAMKSGDIVFKSVNFEDKANKKLLRKLKVSGQALLVISEENRIDLTDKGFLYARSEPEKFSAELKKNIDQYIK